LIQKKSQAAVVGADDERTTPEVRAPVAHRLDEPDELALIRRQLGVSRGDGPAEECDWPGALVKYSSDPRPRGVAFHNEVAVERRKLQNWGCRQRVLKSAERMFCVT
jgi:hypothetical protein